MVDTFCCYFKIHHQIWVPDPVPIPEPVIYEDFEDLSDLDLYNGPSQVVGKVSGSEIHCGSRKIN